MHSRRIFIPIPLRGENRGEAVPAAPPQRLKWQARPMACTREVNPHFMLSLTAGLVAFGLSERSSETSLKSQGKWKLHRAVRPVQYCSEVLFLETSKRFKAAGSPQTENSNCTSSQPLKKRKKELALSSTQLCRPNSSSSVS